MKLRILSLMGLLALFACLLAPRVEACVIVEPDPTTGQPAVKTESIEVSVNIANGVATTKLTQTFEGLSATPAQVAYIFPIPQDGVIDNFAVAVDGVLSQSTLYSAEQATNRYLEILAAGGDPAILEFAGNGAFAGSLGNIGQGEKRTIVITYTEVIPVQGSTARYFFPLSRLAFTSNYVSSIKVEVTADSAREVKSVYTPYQTTAVVRPDDNTFQLSYAATNSLPDSDFLLLYSLGESDFGIDMIFYRDNPPVGGVMTPGAVQDGFFLLMLSPKVDVGSQEVIPKNIEFVIDKSGSMSGSKMTQAKDALAQIVAQLNPDDYFNVVTFNSAVSSFWPQIVPADISHLADAQTQISAINAGGSTNISEGLLTALGGLPAVSPKPNIVVFLTDGQATAGIRDNNGICSAVQSANTMNARFFTFGLGTSLNAVLLDRLAQENGGFSFFIPPSGDVSATLTEFYGKIGSPLLTNLALDFAGAGEYDVYPNSLPDLYDGSQVVLLGRYRSPGSHAVTLTGKIGNQSKTYTAGFNFPEQDVRYSFIPRLWATRRIGALLNEIRLNGETPDLVDEVTRLARRYGIVTPYTSFVIDEDGNTRQDYAAPAGGESGAAAVNDSENINGNMNADSVTNGPRDGAVRVVGNKTFITKDGFWMDVTYDEIAPTQDVEYLSAQYLALLRAVPQLGSYLALGEKVIVCFCNQIYRVADAETLGFATGAGPGVGLPNCLENTPDNPYSPPTQPQNPNVPGSGFSSWGGGGCSVGNSGQSSGLAFLFLLVLGMVAIRRRM